MKLQLFPWKLALRLGLLAVAAFMLVMFQRSCEVGRQEAAQRRQIDCTDRACAGDAVPAVAEPSQVAFKKNGEWYLAPRKYGNPNFGALAFFWPSRAPSGDVDAASKAAELKFGPQRQVLNGYDHLVEIFLTGRARWPDPSVQQPWEGRGWEGRFDDFIAKGLQIQRTQLTPELERVRFTHPDGKPYRHEFFLASTQRKLMGDGVPGAACDLYPDPGPNALPRCTGGFFWREDVYADFRFHARHANDWPAIHQEMLRVLNLLKKVQP